MRKYQEPEISVELFNVEDIIATSPGTGSGSGADVGTGGGGGAGL